MKIVQTPISYTVTREAIMALTSAEKQQRYHVRRLGIHGTKRGAFNLSSAFRQEQRPDTPPPNV